MTKSEGQAVRVAFTGPSVKHDELIASIDARNREDRIRSSSAGESRQKIAAFLEETSMNSKAYSWMRQILKINDKDDGQAKAMDVIASLEATLPMIKAHVAGQGTYEMNFEPDGEYEDEELPDPVEYEDEETEAFDAEVNEVLADDKVKPVDFARAAR